jgi:hypothetical protein
MDRLKSASAMQRTLRLRGHNTEELAEECGPSGLTASDGWNPLLKLSPAPAPDARAQEAADAPMRGQTIIAAIAVGAWGAYNLTGHDIGSMANGIDSALTSA